MRCRRGSGQIEQVMIGCDGTGGGGGTTGGGSGGTTIRLQPHTSCNS